MLVRQTLSSVGRVDRVGDHVIDLFIDSVPIRSLLLGRRRVGSVFLNVPFSSCEDDITDFRL